MYSGYRLKIGDAVFPNSYIAKGTYKCVEKKRVVGTFVDAYEVEHVEVTSNKKAVIQFSIREHNSKEHAEIMNLLSEDDDIVLTFYSDRTDSYRTGNFRCEEITFGHLNAIGNNIEYAATPVTLTEN